MSDLATTLAGLPLVSLVVFLPLVGAIALAFLSYYLVEKPFLRLKDKPFSSLWRRTPAKVSS